MRENTIRCQITPISLDIQQYNRLEKILSVGSIHLLSSLYCLSKKSWPILYCKLLYTMGQDFLDKQLKNFVAKKKNNLDQHILKEKNQK